MNKILKLFKSKRLLLSVVLVGVFVMASFAVGESVEAQFADSGDVLAVPQVQVIEGSDEGSDGPRWTLSIFIAGVIWLLNLLFGAIILLEGVIIAIFTALLKVVVGYNGFVESTAVQIGWTLVRDLTNLFFVVVLLIIAFGTILRLGDNYSIKKLLPKVLIMAVLVNFSLVIAGLLIDASQVIMLTFVAAFDESVGFNLFNTLGIKDATSIKTFANTGTATELISTLTSVFVTNLMAILFLFISMFTIVVMTLIFVARIVALWILLVLAPLPYVLFAFPRLKQYATMWWTEFTKYLIIGPVMAFFLWLAFAVVNQEGFSLFEDASSSIGGLGSDESVNKFLKESGVFNRILEKSEFTKYVISIAMLFAGMIAAQKAGVAGGNLAGSALAGIKKKGLAPFMGAASLVGKLPGTASKVLYGKFGIGLSPRRIREGFSARYAKWEGRMESAGTAKGVEKARALIASEGKFGTGAFKRSRGLLRYATTSPEDFAQLYMGSRGIKNAFQTVIKGTGTDDLEKFEEIKRKELEGADEAERLSNIGDVSDKGREILIKDTADGMRADLDAKNKSLVTEKDVSGKIKTKGIDFADFDDFISTAEKKHLKELGLDEKYEIIDGKKGVRLDNDDAKERFKQDFIQIHAERMVNDLGIYEDKATGKIQDVKDTIITTAGNKYYDDEEDRMDAEIIRINTGGISDSQLANRQNELAGINRQMLEILKKIESQDNTVSADQRQALVDLKAEGLQLGGIAFRDRVTGMNHFGKSVTDRSTQELSHTIMATMAPSVYNRTTKEDEELGDIVKKTKLLDTQRDNFKNEKAMAKDTPLSRRGKQTTYKKSAKDIREDVAAREKKLKDKAIPVPIPYEAIAKLRATEKEELSKLPDAMEWGEIEGELKMALKLKNKGRVRALMKKAAVDFNDNEIWKAWGYSEDAEGMKNFGNNELMDKLGMGKQEMLNFMDDMAYINEGKGHYETSRMVTLTNGVSNWASEETHAALVANEILKRPSRTFLQNTNRLGYGGDDSDGNYKLALSGKLTLAGFGDTELQYRIERGELNPSTLAKIVSDREGLLDMVRQGLLSQDTIELMDRESGKRLSADYKKLYEKGTAINQ